MLLRDTGKTVLQHTYEAACRARQPEAVLIATDDEEIAAEARRFGADVVMTSPDCPSGTDRIAEAVRELPRAGDHRQPAGRRARGRPGGDRPAVRTAGARTLGVDGDGRHADSRARASSTTRRASRWRSTAAAGRCTSAAASIPHPREWDDALLAAEPPAFYQHLGMYAYRRPFLMQMTEWPVGRLEQIEKLEQLRVLENGHAILVAVVERATRGIDTPEDYAAFVARCRAA